MSSNNITLFAQVGLESALGLSVIANICLLIAVVVLLVKIKSLHCSKPRARSMEKEDEAKDIEMKPNVLYGLTNSKDVCGQDTMADNYEYVIP